MCKYRERRINRRQRGAAINAGISSVKKTRRKSAIEATKAGATYLANGVRTVYDIIGGGHLLHAPTAHTHACTHCAHATHCILRAEHGALAAAGGRGARAKWRVWNGALATPAVRDRALPRLCRLLAAPGYILCRQA